MGKPSRDKGARVERMFVNAHISSGIHAERVPLSGAVHYQGNGGDIDVYWNGKDEAPVACEIKARKDGAGFKTLEEWMGDHEVMFLKRDRRDPMVVMSWEFWLTLLLAINNFQNQEKDQ